ncbi:MAG: ABC transporter ATP-binding protein [Lachnospiraceae bacterium]|nr:ABC transporter ATP-binding protein [Lachnospiraceae bacterium]
MDNVLELKDLSLSFDTKQGEIQAVRGVNLSLKKGEILAVVGESGCGKTVMSKAVLKLLPKNSKIKTGSIVIDGEDITGYSESKMRSLRGSVVSMVFQDPMTTLNPTIPIGKQIAEAVLKHNKVSREEAKKRALEMLNLVGIDDTVNRYYLQPHYFSGGMRQRCVLAIALASNPKVLFADEPTTALDVTVQAKILDLLLEIREKTGISIVFISHDFGVVARIADRVAVMYAGKIVEIGTVEDIFYDPRHPYTWGLMSSLPYLAKEGKCLESIQGIPPVMVNLPKGDAFAIRNKYALEIDYELEPPMFEISATHSAATWLLDERAPLIKPPFSIKGGLKHG